MPGPHPAPLDNRPHIADAATRFRALHANFFVMPNPYDRGTAMLLADLGFGAIATSSAALAWTLGRADGSIDRDTAIAHARAMADATGLPVNGDFEAGYGDTPAEVAETIERAIDAGVAGCSVEDIARDRPEPLLDAHVACLKLEAAREAIERAGSDFVLTARCEAFLTDDPAPLGTVLARLPAYERAGAHVVYAPKLTRSDEVEAVLAAVGVPLNVLAGLGGVSNDLPALQRLGVRRISLGGGLAKAALGGFIAAAEALLGNRVELAGAAPGARLEALFSTRRGAA